MSSDAGIPVSADEVVVGIIGRAHGIRGEVFIELRTDEPHRRFVASRVLRAEDSERTFAIETVRDHSGRLLAKFHELADRTAAEAARGIRLVVDVDPAEQPEGDGEFYDRHLIGLGVRDAHDAQVGTVIGVAHTPGQDLLEIDTGTQTRLVPFVLALVPEVDLAAGLVRLADVPGLLSDLDD
jgi:16S rRNA processing protein RimM